MLTNRFAAFIDPKLDSSPNPDADPASIKASTSDWILLATLNEEFISKENQLISDRIDWMNTTQSFLFGAFCLIAISSNSTSKIAKNLMIAIPALGLVTLIGSVLGVVGARMVILELEKHRSVFQRKLDKLFGINLPPLGPSEKDRFVHLGWLEAYLSTL